MEIQVQHEPTTQVNRKIIQESDTVLIIENETRYLFSTLKPKTKAKIGKKEVLLDHLIGKPYGIWFELKDGQLCDYDPRSRMDKASEEEEDNIEKNNKDLYDKSDAQKLTQEDIDALKKSGVQGEDLVKIIVENSESFAQKTKFSQEKYVKKKKKKHHIVIQVLRPTSHLICKAYFTKSPEKIRHIRVDTLSSILMYANVRPYSKVVVYEKCSGLINGSLLEKMNETGKIYNIHDGMSAPLHIVNLFGFSDKSNQVIRNIPTGCLLSDIEGDEAWKHSKIELKKELEAEQGCDSLVICGTNYPKDYFNLLYKYLKTSGTFVIYSQYVQHLAEIDSYLHLNKQACHIQISETWYRESQVLKNRTHPTMQMDATSGFVLTGIKISVEEGKNGINENKKMKVSE